MKKIRQWLSDRRDRKLRERLLKSGLSPIDAEITYLWLKTGKLYTKETISFQHDDKE